MQSLLLIKRLSQLSELLYLISIKFFIGSSIKIIAPTTHGFSYKKKFDNIYPNLAKKYDLNLIPFLLKGVALNPDFNQNDGIHPNEKGTFVISKTLLLSIVNKIK